MSQSDHALRKVAILLDSLDPQAADALLERMPAEQASRVRELLARLEPVDAAEREQIVRRFIDEQSADRFSTSEAVEMDDSLAQRIAAGADAADEEGEQEESRVPFSFLDNASIGQLRCVLAQQRPQITSVVLAHLPSDRAADVLKGLSAEVQADVLHRLARLEQADTEVLEEIERELELTISQHHRSVSERRPGLSAVESILAATDPDDRQRLLAQLEACDSRLVRQLGYPGQATPEGPTTERDVHADAPADARTGLQQTLADLNPERWPPDQNLPSVRETQSGRFPTGSPADTDDACSNEQTPFDFDDLVELDDDLLASIIRAAGPHVTLVALAGARQEFLQRITSPLSARDAKQLRRQMEELRPLRLRDVAWAQQHLARLAGELRNQGTVEVSERRRLLAAA
jgi:flagellar motor switch protein FliG